MKTCNHRGLCRCNAPKRERDAWGLSRADKKYLKKEYDKTMRRPVVAGTERQTIQWPATFGKGKRNPFTQAELAEEEKRPVLERRCMECRKPMGPEIFLGPVCGKCVRKLHAKVTGRKRNIPLLLINPKHRKWAEPDCSRLSAGEKEVLALARRIGRTEHIHPTRALISLSSGTIASLTGVTKYADIDRTVARLTSYLPQVPATTRGISLEHRYRKNPKASGLPPALRKYAHLPNFMATVKKYKQFHGCMPTKVTMHKIPIGDDKKVVPMVAIGRTDESVYRPTPGMKRSNKARSTWIHKWKQKPMLATDASGKLLVTVLKGKARVADWMRG